MVFKKKIFGFLILGFLLLLAGKASAYRDVNYYTLSTSAGTLISGLTINSVTTTAAIKTRDNVGNMSFVITVSGGNVQVTQQVSLDNVIWFAPSTTDGTTLTSVPGVVSSLATSSWIVLTSRMAPYTRFLISPVSGTPVVTAQIAYQSELNL